MRKITTLILTLCLLISAAGCGSGAPASSVDAGQESPTPLETPLPEEAPPAEADSQPEPTPGEESGPEAGTGPEETPQPEPTPEPVPSPTPAPPSVQEDGGEGLSKDDIFQRFVTAMTALEQSLSLDVSGIEWQYGAENDLKNIYYSVLSEHPELKYTYDLQPSVSGDTAVCTFCYMPYKTGAYDNALPAGSHTVDSLRSAKGQAQSMIDGTERMSIAITDPSLNVDDIKNALGQAGYGWIRFELSRDGTEIVANPPVGKTLADCVAAINESFRLGGEVLSAVLTDGMTDREKAEALYGYVVENTAYDFRYYSDRDNMPYESTVALGALRDGLAICGGYAQAFETLLDMAGIENYTVSGVSHKEYHMWNYVVLDGVGYYCDPTADRGGMSNHFMLTEEELTALGGYEWDSALMGRLSAR